MDLHHNLFYSYRGPIPDEGARERQLENNVTKALVNTLRLGGESVWRPFLVELGVAEAAQAEFLLQRSDLPSGPASLKKQRVLLGISSTPSNSPHAPTSDEIYASVPDAWIYGDGFAVLVESKVVGGFVEGQMHSHIARLRANGNASPSVDLKTWRDLHRFFRALRCQLSGVPAFLVDQFIEYLEYSELSGFTGFRREHFDYFLTHDDEEARHWVKSQVEDLAQRLQKCLLAIDSFYESWDMGTLYQSASYCWVAFGPANGGYRKKTHQSIAMSSDGVRVFVNAELKPAADRIKQVLRQKPESVRAALHDIHKTEPFDLVLEERIQKQASIYDYTPKMRLHSSLIIDDTVGGPAWTAFVDTVLTLPLPYVRIERLLKPSTLLDASSSSDDAAIEIIAEAMRRNHGLVQMLNM